MKPAFFKNTKSDENNMLVPSNYKKSRASLKTHLKEIVLIDCILFIPAHVMAKAKRYLQTGGTLVPKLSF